MKTKEVVKTFYDAFQKRDYKTMQSLYALNSVFTDPVFPNLTSFQAGGMWEMLLKAGKDLEMDYKIVDTSKTKAKVKWTAKYTFTKTGRKVINKVTSELEIIDGKIVIHRDSFNFRRWARQALGFFPWMFSFTGITQKKVQEQALIALNDYIRKEGR